VLENYQQAPALEEAVALMARSYDKLGMNDLRDDALKVLKHNFPNSPFLTSEGKLPEKTWWKFW
jgi:outer membrane protein assembly factor BamD